MLLLDMKHLKFALEVMLLWVIEFGHDVTSGHEQTLVGYAVGVLLLVEVML